MIRFFLVFFSALLFFNIPAALPLTIEARVGKGAWKSAHAVDALSGQEVSLRIRQVENASVRWYQIVPDTNTRYNNAVWPWLPNAYKWKGFAQIGYSKVPLSQFDDQWQITVLPGQTPENRSTPVSPTDDSLLSYIKQLFLNPEKVSSQLHKETLGSFWYQAEIRKGRTIHQTHGIESKDNRGLSPKVFRVSVKQGNNLIGNLTSYFNVPAVFGSTPYQVRNYIGIDCADVLMAAYCKTKKLPIKKDYNVAMLTRKFPTVAKTEIRNGQPSSVVQWGKEIRAGDFIAVKYAGARQYQHIGALYKDQNNNGVLDKKDLILHAGPDPLHWSQLHSGTFDGTVMILRAM